ncbi:glycosyltransferase family 2 protein [Falsigemmobacter intermedius]|uniref:Glycosyltransferase family 2 protein n=1 Tax=Falsigemmobacter intermedius TaxID=1553448 RepID=A0A3S3UL35_9RHOB|nr:glycosyltransferase family 2 protein [Falsigemmobacter intermedius]RWY45504.1 glycosyltransferase family 2 protein [Falsigemmobacter intermedius]
MAAQGWGVAVTLKAPVAQVLAFVAWYLDLGAARIWLHFDDPEDPAAARLEGHERVQVIRCHDGYWEKVAGRRPETHQQRQVRNVTRVLRRTGLPWVAHFDVDEFLLAARPVADILAEQAPDRLILRAEPWEALCDPKLPDDIFTANRFRQALPPGREALAHALYGEAGALLERGMLSHTVGKCFFRSGIPGMTGRIHGARINGEPVPGGAFHPDLALLHFHAQDREGWLSRLPYRLARGAYQYRPAMQAYLLEQTAEGVEAFYDTVQRARPALVAALEVEGFLRQEELSLRQRVGRHFPGLLPGSETPESGVDPSL